MPGVRGRRLRTMTTAVAVAAVLATSGCSLFGGEDERAGSGPDGAGSESLRTASGTLRDAGAADAEPVALTEELPVAGTAVTSVDGQPVEVDLNGVVVDGAVMSVVFTVRNTGDESAQIAQAFDDGLSNEIEGVGITAANVFTSGGVYVLDGRNGKRHEAAYDSAGYCVCSRQLELASVAPGQQVVLSTTFSAVPEDVETVTVSIPLAGQFADVSVTR